MASLSVLAGWDRKEREHAARADDLLPTNKDALFGALGAAGITTVIVTFDGYGDSGQIESIEAKAGNDRHAAAWHDRNGKSRLGIYRNAPAEPVASRALTYALLGQTHGGWENNEGAYGDFTFDMAERTITLDYNERHMESDYSQHIF